MQEIIEKIGNSAAFTAFQDFVADYGLYIAAFLTGMLIVYAIWFKKHPEDFYSREETTEEAKETEER